MRKETADRILEFDEQRWELSYISPLQDGFVVTERLKIRESLVNKQELAKFNKEFAMCRVLADNGHDIQYLHSEGRAKGQTYDILFDGIPADLKAITGNGSNIKQYVLAQG